LQGNAELHFEFFTFFVVVGGGRNVVEIDESCFSRQNSNCSRLRTTAWVFVDVEQELVTPVLHMSLITALRHCSPSLSHVSYPTSQSSMTAVGMSLSSMKVSHTTLSIALFLWRTDAHKNRIEATWKHVNIHLSPY
jgi:hypothetical protein